MAKSSFPTRVARRLFRARKSVYQKLMRRSESQSILFILGCQRSGTTLLSEIFHRDFNAKSYGEFSTLTSQDENEGLRLNPVDAVREEFSQLKTPLIVAKPLVESQNASYLLETFSGSFSLWAYRNYRDVAQSNIKKFGIRNGIKYLQPIVNSEPGNWRSEKISESTKEIVSSFFSEEMNPPDAHALCWYTRNILFFEQHLESDERVILCKYEELVADPGKIVKCIYDLTGQTYPGDSIVSETHASSIGTGRDLNISTEVDQLCMKLLQKLDVANGNRRSATLAKNTNVS